MDTSPLVIRGGKLVDCCQFTVGGNLYAKPDEEACKEPWLIKGRRVNQNLNGGTQQWCIKFFFSRQVRAGK